MKVSSYTASAFDLDVCFGSSLGSTRKAVKLQSYRKGPRGNRTLQHCAIVSIGLGQRIEEIPPVTVDTTSSWHGYLDSKYCHRYREPVRVDVFTLASMWFAPRQTSGGVSFPKTVHVSRTINPDSFEQQVNLPQQFVH